MAARRVEKDRVNGDVPPQVEKVLQGGQRVQGAQDSQVPPQGDLFLMWKEALRYRRCLLGRIERL